MKHLPLGLFIGHLLFISIKSLETPITFQELGLSALLFMAIYVPKAIKSLHRASFRKYTLEKEKLDMDRPKTVDPEIASLQRDNDLAALRLKKFMTEAEFKKREIARAVENKVGEGGLKF